MDRDKLSFSIERIENGWLIGELYPVSKRRQWFCADQQAVLDTIDNMLSNLASTGEQHVER